MQGLRRIQAELARVEGAEQSKGNQAERDDGERTQTVAAPLGVAPARLGERQPEVQGRQEQQRGKWVEEPDEESESEQQEHQREPASVVVGAGVKAQAAHECGPSEPGEGQHEERGEDGLKRGRPGGEPLREERTGGGGDGVGEAEQAGEESGEQERQRAGERPLQAPSHGEAAAAGAGEAVDKHEQRREQQREDEQPQGPGGKQLALQGKRGFKAAATGEAAQIVVGVERVDGAERGATEVLKARGTDGLAGRRGAVRR